MEAEIEHNGGHKDAEQHNEEHHGGLVEVIGDEMGLNLQAVHYFSLLFCPDAIAKAAQIVGVVNDHEKVGTWIVFS